MLLRSFAGCCALLAGIGGAADHSGLGPVPNGLSTNGLSTNGVWVNGLSANGLSANGASASGVATDRRMAPGARLKVVILTDGSVITF